MTDERTFIYRTDAENRIVFVNREWLDFARDNQAPELTADHVLGERLESFIAGWETRHLYEMVYEKVRRTGREIRFAFRCDSPTHRRYFQMRIGPLEGNGLEFGVRVERIEPYFSGPFLDRTADRAPEVVVLCSWCKKVRIDEDAWCEIEDATGEIELFGSTAPTLTHEICPGCLSALHRNLEGREDGLR